MKISNEIIVMIMDVEGSLGALFCLPQFLRVVCLGTAILLLLTMLRGPRTKQTLLL